MVGRFGECSSIPAYYYFFFSKSLMQKRRGKQIVSYLEALISCICNDDAKFHVL